MKAPVDILFPTPESGWVPYWRLPLRGCSQLCFQTNELTGLFFVAAVLIESPISAVYMLVAATLAPAGRMLLGDRGAVLATGMPGLNPCLIALSLPAFFETGWSDLGMWGVLVLSVAATVGLTRLGLAVLPFPILVLPFLIVFWILWAVEPHVALLRPATFAAAPDTAIHPIVAVLLGLGQTLFSPNVWSGLLFLGGVLVSNWRHALLALAGAVVGTGVSYHYSRQADLAGIDMGLYGFNGVLAAVAVYLFCGGHLRLSILGALIATILVSVVPEFGVQAVSAPYALATWVMLALGWIDEKWFAPSPAASLTGSAPAAGPHAEARMRALETWT